MKPQLKSLVHRLFVAPRLTRADLALTFIPAVLWAGLSLVRPWVIIPRCVQNPIVCQTQSVPSIDRYALAQNSARADEASYHTQNLSGALAAFVPLGWAAGQILTGGTPWNAALSMAGIDLTLVFQAVFWNGTFNELARLIFQRPRPFVFASPERYGADLQNYTSFYSGHTSFSAVACTTLLLNLFGRGAPTFLLVFAGVAGETLVLLTGLFRILAGRHFFTDTLAGALAGTLVALIVALMHRHGEKT